MQKLFMGNLERKNLQGISVLGRKYGWKTQAGLMLFNSGYKYMER